MDTSLTMLITLIVILAALSLLVGVYYGWSYRGWRFKSSREERRKVIVSILSHLDEHEREEFLNFIDGLRTASKSTG